MGTIEQRLTIKDVAILFKVTTKTIDTWCEKKGFPYEVLPCGKRFNPRAIEAYLADRRRGHEIPESFAAEAH